MLHFWWIAVRYCAAVLTGHMTGVACPYVRPSIACELQTQKLKGAEKVKLAWTFPRDMYMSNRCNPLPFFSSKGCTLVFVIWSSYVFLVFTCCFYLSSRQQRWKHWTTKSRNNISSVNRNSSRPNGWSLLLHCCISIRLCAGGKVNKDVGVHAVRGVHSSATCRDPEEHARVCAAQGQNRQNPWRKFDLFCVNNTMIKSRHCSYCVTIKFC